MHSFHIEVVISIQLENGSDHFIDITSKETLENVNSVLMGNTTLEQIETIEGCIFSRRLLSILEEGGYDFSSAEGLEHFNHTKKDLFDSTALAEVSICFYSAYNHPKLYYFFDHEQGWVLSDHEGDFTQPFLKLILESQPKLEDFLN